MNIKGQARIEKHRIKQDKREQRRKEKRANLV